MSKKFEKRGRNVPRSSEEEKSGYCQVCGRYCDDLAEHARDSQHGPYPPLQFPQLETIFDYCDLNKMGCLKKSLRIVKSPPSEIFEKQSLELPVVPMNGRIPHSKLDKAALYNGFFSSKRSNGERSDSADEEEEEEEIFSKDESSDESEDTGKQTTKRPKKVSRKRLSVEEKLIEDNKSYYRVEVINSKLRSTKYFVSRKQAELKTSDGTVNRGSSDEVETSGEEDQDRIAPETEPEGKKEPVVVRFKKVRKSQLAVLSDEAESFMLKDSGRRDHGTKDVSTSPAQWSDTDSFSSSSQDDELPKMKKMVRDSDDSSPPDIDLGLNSNSSPPTLNCDHDSVSEQEDSIEDSSRGRISLDSLTFSFESPPKHEPWLETYKRLEEGKTKYFYPYYHKYPKILLPYEYPSSDKLKLLSGKKASGYGRRRGRWSQEDSRARKSPRCHASTLAVMSNFLKRPSRECSKTSDFSYEEESRSSLPDTVDTSSSHSEFRSHSSFTCDANMLPDDSCGDVFATALARVARGEASTLNIAPGPCLAVNPRLLDDPPQLEISLRPGPTVPLEVIINRHSDDTSWMDYDYSRVEEEKTPSRYPSPHSVQEEKSCPGVPYSWPELPLRKRRKRIKKEEESSPVVPRVLIKCEPCEIKLEPMSAKILEQFSIKHDSLPVKRKAPAVRKKKKKKEPPPPLPNGMKRGRGRPRKIIPPVDIEPQLTELPSISQQPPTKTYLKKSPESRFPLNQRSFINQIV